MLNCLTLACYIFRGPVPDINFDGRGRADGWWKETKNQEIGSKYKKKGKRSRSSKPCEQLGRKSAGRRSRALLLHFLFFFLMICFLVCCLYIRRPLALVEGEAKRDAFTRRGGLGLAGGWRFAYYFLGVPKVRYAIPEKQCFWSSFG